MKTANVLSIDWDYFFNATLETRSKLFPDGGDLPPLVEQTVWASHYSSPSLLRVRALTAKLAKLHDFLYANIPYATSAMLVNSHRHCYEYVRTRFNGVPINIVNIDFHHDVYTNNSKLDCGNWLEYLCNDMPRVKPYWVASPTSDTSNMGRTLSRLTFDEALKKHYNGVFVCRSGLWSPPHLDKHFIHTFEVMKNYPNVVVEQGILDNRYNKEFKSTCEQIQQFYLANQNLHLG